MSRILQREGFTLIEVVVAVLISSLLLAALLRFLVAGYPLSRVTLLQSNSNEAARTQLKRIARELRRVRESDTGSYALVEMLPQKIVFYANIDGDAATERVRYELIGTNLERGIINPTASPVQYVESTEATTVVTRLVQNGTDPIFTYYSGDYPDDDTALTPVDVTEVKYIEFRLLIDADADSDPAPVEVISQVQLRNLKTNLGELASP